jgi:hypothetical protein
MLALTLSGLWKWTGLRTSCRCALFHCVWYCHRSHSFHSFRDRITSFQQVNRAHAQGANSRLPTGSTLLKQRQLGQLGYKVVSVPYWEWDALRRDRDQEQAYLFRALAGCVPPQAPRKKKREAKKDMVPKNEADEEDKDALLDERLTSVDWDDDATLKKLTNELLKQYLKKHNLRSSGLNKARAQFCSALLVRFETHYLSGPSGAPGCERPSAPRDA